MENQILTLFAHEPQLTFSNIKERIKIRSNLLSYWLKKMIQKGIIIKSGRLYKLAESSEHLVPYLSENKSTLPVILIILRNKNKVFLHKREKRPYKGLLSIPGGRLLIGESINDAARRIMKVKFGVNIEKISIKSIHLEHVKKNKSVVYSFLLITTQAATRDTLNFIDFKKVRAKIIPSDYQIINSTSDDPIHIKTITSAFK